MIDGILILIDEADKPDPSVANLGEFVKTFTEKLTKRHCDRVCLGLAGLPSIIEKLKRGHESSLRVFVNYTLAPLLDGEAEDVVRRGLREAKDKGEKETTIASNALSLLVGLAEGYPHFIQQFSYCAFACDGDFEIGLTDVLEGAYNEYGALDQLGQKYFQEMYFVKVSSGDYRKVLDAMAEKLDAWVSRQEIIALCGIKKTQVNNAINALKSRNIIVANDERKGEYKLPTRSFAVWIKALNEKKKLMGKRGAPQGSA